MARDLDAGRFSVPDPITVTLTRPDSYRGGPAVSAQVQRVQDQAAREGEVTAPNGGSLAGTRKTFRLWLAECQSMPPHKGYVITKADDTAWVIQEVEPLSHGRQFRCHCLLKKAVA